MVSVPLTSSDAPFRLHLSGVVTAGDLRQRLHPLRTSPPPRRVVLTCDDDVRVRPAAIGLLYQTLMHLLTNDTSDRVDLLVVAGAPRPLLQTLRGLVDNLSSKAEVRFVDRMDEVSSVLARRNLHARLSTAVPYRSPARSSLRDQLLDLRASAPGAVSRLVNDAA